MSNAVKTEDNMKKFDQVIGGLLVDALEAYKVLTKLVDVGIVTRWVYNRDDGLYDVVFYYPIWKYNCNGWNRIEMTLAEFRVNDFLMKDKDTFTVTKFSWGNEIYSPAALLAKLIKKQKEKLASVTKLREEVEE
ncbi:hypothetical protein [Neomoorella thermoacetica]|nr:hypothetical protein [Moorella thermoacetica]APC09066.1 hypothetical protein MTJW_19160 [Moorella thermoacetica]OIQ54987.1 hypothetical protein MORE_07330 [Moorella thermoacetica]